MEDLTGKQLGPYQITQPMGQGGMASVFKAFQPSMDRYVALKVLPRHLAGDPKFIARFTREAKLIAKLEHPHILPVYDFGESDNYTYLVMRLVEGGSLAALIKRREQLSFADINKFITQTGDALDYAHAHGVIHRDVKPANILLDHMGNCLLTDFGVAKMTEVSGQLTQTGHVLGTPAYVSPEQGMGLELDGRSDIYALGVILYQLVIGQLPFNADTPMALVIKHIHDPLPPPRQIVPSLPESIERIILKAMAKERDDRYAKARDMTTALEQAVAQMPGAGTELVIGQALDKTGKVLPTKTIHMKADRKKARFPLKKVIIPAGGILLISLLALLLLSPRQEKPPADAENSASVTSEPPAAPAQNGEQSLAGQTQVLPEETNITGDSALSNNWLSQAELAWQQEGYGETGEREETSEPTLDEQTGSESGSSEPELAENLPDNDQAPLVAARPARTTAIPYQGAVISGNRKKKSTQTLTFSLAGSPAGEFIKLNATSLNGVSLSRQQQKPIPLHYRSGKREFYLPINKGKSRGKFYKFRFDIEDGKFIGFVDITDNAPGSGFFIGHFIAGRHASLDLSSYDPFPKAAQYSLSEARLTPAPASRMSRPLGAVELEFSLDFSGQHDKASFTFAGQAPLKSEVSWQPGNKPTLKYHYLDQHTSYHLEANLHSDNEPTLETESLILLGTLTTEKKEDFYFIGKNYQVTMLITDYESIIEPFGKWLGWAQPLPANGADISQAFKGSAKAVRVALGSTKNTGGLIKDKKSGQARIVTIEKIKLQGKTWTALAGGQWYYILARPDNRKIVLISSTRDTIFICLRKI